MSLLLKFNPINSMISSHVIVIVFSYTLILFNHIKRYCIDLVNIVIHGLKINRFLFKFQLLNES